LDEGALAFLEKKKKAKSCMHKLPPNLVGAYAEQDARVTYDVAMKQKPLLTAEGLERVMALEMSLTPHLLDMTFRGVRIDIGLAERANRQWRQAVQALLR
jgi:DNA polymerase-1